MWASILGSLRERFADSEWLMIDSTVVRAHQHAAGARGGQDAQALGRSKGGFSSKIHLLSDALGYPLQYIVTGGERADCTQALALLRQCVQTPEAVIADKGYDSDAIREGVMQQVSAAVIPAKTNRKTPVHHDKLLYAARHLAENAIN
ncbi:MAG: IS5 family transposase, partial [Puniceicoccales bacterium]